MCSCFVLYYYMKIYIFAIFLRWADGEPKNQGYYDDEDCVEMNKEYDFMWNDEGCKAQRR